MNGEEYITIRIPKELADEMDELIGKRGFRTRAEIAKEAIRKFLSEYKPHLEHFNIDVEKQCVRVIDHKRRCIADVYFTEKGIWCEWDNSTDCEHVKYALEIPKVREILRKHGWEIEEGKLKKRKW